MDKALATTMDGAIIENVVVGGDLSQLTPAQRVSYYNQVCQSMGLNPLTKPFSYLKLNGKLVLYALKDATEQLRKLHKISVTISSRDKMDTVYIVTARATTPDGRTDESTGVVNLASLKGDALANALMKAETKAKRRVTLSIVGLGWLDETELDTIPDAYEVPVDTNTGEILEAQVKPEVKPQAKSPKRDKLMARLNDLMVEAQELSGGDRFNPFHLQNHLQKYYEARTLDDLTDEQVIALGKHVAAEVEEMKAQLEAEGVEHAHAMPGGLEE